jgi:membrane protease YdiL (CAAX protease family)
MEERDTADEPKAGALPPSGGRSPDWPPWFGFVGFLAAVFGAVTAVSVLGLIFGVEAGEEPSSLTIIGTLLQGVFFVVAAVLLAWTVARPRAWHFGLRRAPLGPTVRAAALGMGAFYLLTVAYAAIVRPDVEQGVTERLGAEDGTLLLIVAGVMVILVAPVVEEIFFRGFFYRALRTRYPVRFAAVFDGVLFGLIHYDFESSDSLLLLPPLALIGLLFCLVYERTGTLWAPIGMHAFNNMIAFAAQTPDGWRVAVVLGPLMLAACALAPRLLPDGPRALPVSPRRVGPDAQLSLPVE